MLNCNTYCNEIYLTIPFANRSTTSGETICELKLSTALPVFQIEIYTLVKIIGMKPSEAQMKSFNQLKWNITKIGDSTHRLLLKFQNKQNWLQMISSSPPERLYGNYWHNYAQIGLFEKDYILLVVQDSIFDLVDIIERTEKGSTAKNMLCMSFLIFTTRYLTICRKAKRIDKQFYLRLIGFASALRPSNIFIYWLQCLSTFWVVLR